MKIDLFIINPGNRVIDWPYGSKSVVASNLIDLRRTLDHFAKTSNADACFIWDPNMGELDLKKIETLLDQPFDVWHPGLLLGLGGQPHLIDYVVPTWMLNRDPDSSIEATSWRISLRCCLIRTRVLKEMGGLRKGFESHEAAGLEMGHRFIARGVRMRYVPTMILEGQRLSLQKLSCRDEVRFIRSRFGMKWAWWALLRAVMTGCHSFKEGVNSIKVLYSTYSQDPAPFQHPLRRSLDPEAKVSILIPTLNRYSYLHVLLKQIEKQKIKPFEVIIVDQTPVDRRDHTLKDHDQLPLKIIYLDKPGQCSARNAGLGIARGNYILFLDDDDEIPENLIEEHLMGIHTFNCETSSGVVIEKDINESTESFNITRISDIFPTNNTLIKRKALDRSKLFDGVYDHGARADQDLGMRMYLSGATMILYRQAKLFHHHAPQGGLRTHKARVVTYDASRNKLFKRQIPGATELYLEKRYYRKDQCREMHIIRVFGTFSARGNAVVKVLKFLASLIMLPDTLLRIRSSEQQAKQLINQGPKIPTLKVESGAQHS